MKILLSAVLFFSFAASAEVIDKTEELNQVELKSGKENNTRIYSGTTYRSIKANITSVKNSITNFTEKCNNAYQSKRTLTDEKAECKYHNEQLIETKVVEGARFPEKVKPGEAMLLARRVYNRGTYQFYDLVQIEEGLNHLQQKTITVNVRMLEDEEAKKLTELKIEKDSVFDRSEANFTLTEVSSNETTLQYKYQVSTSHWLLNKEIIVPQVFVSISKGMNDVIASIEQGSGVPLRDVASK